MLSTYDETILKNGLNNPGLLLEFKNRLESISNFSSKNILNEFKSYLEEKQLTMGKLLPALRVSLTGLGMGPSLLDIASLLGREETIKRIEVAIEKIN